MYFKINVEYRCFILFKKQHLLFHVLVKFSQRHCHLKKKFGKSTGGLGFDMKTIESVRIK